MIWGCPYELRTPQLSSANVIRIIAHLFLSSTISYLHFALFLELFDGFVTFQMAKSSGLTMAILGHLRQLGRAAYATVIRGEYSQTHVFAYF